MKTTEVMDTLRAEIRRLREENHMLRAEIVCARRDRDHYQTRWLNSEDCWRPGTYQNGA